eukprot:CAMPEP_0179180224 /NCGR_PEP_ID=MMETSP0796-20121207/89216_1 /TAXON_ID=73915 /ORGANISM="Pyrodinium bahamense, Strain pbaha01" /LENGTH=108 /DNA_ID=CAMNT_0020883921 /DNA_START=30 /DNA_END=356 /DNA_ORIENTATION=+
MGSPKMNSFGPKGSGSRTGIIFGRQKRCTSVSLPIWLALLCACPSVLRAAINVALPAITAVLAAAPGAMGATVSGGGAPSVALVSLDGMYTPCAEPTVTPSRSGNRRM